MDLAQFYSSADAEVIFDEARASRFAKAVAGDFNPLHDPGNKRFCVPGDLLFAVMLDRYGVAETTGVAFNGMLDGKSRMKLPDAIEEHAVILDSRERPLLDIFLRGRRSTQKAFVTALWSQYVAFSGKTFPDVLVPLMREAEIMINPDRPLVIYKDMSLEFSDTSRFGFVGVAGAEAKPVAKEKTQPVDQAGMGEPLESGMDLQVALQGSDISVNGRKGAVRLTFEITVNRQIIARGVKNMVLSGLRPYDETAMQHIVNQYQQWKAAYAEPVHAS